MSNQQNEVLLENYAETFQEAVKVENWALARGVIEDMKDAGFKESANVLEEELFRVQNIPHAKLTDIGIETT